MPAARRSRSTSIPLAPVAPMSTITGRVTYGTDPLSGITVVAIDPASQHVRTFTSTAADGTFTIPAPHEIGYEKCGNL